MKPAIRAFLLCQWAVFFALSGASAQSAGVIGDVRDSRTGQPIKDAELEYLVPFMDQGTYEVYTMRDDTLIALIARTKTDERGAFVLNPLPHGEGMVRFHKIMMDSIGDRYDEVRIHLDKGQALAVHLLLPEVCPWRTKNNRSGVCPICRRMDAVIPIVYGEPS